MPKTNLSKINTPTPSPVSLVPDPVTPDLTAILIDRLSDDLVKDLDLKDISGKVFIAVLNKVKKSVFNFLSTPSNSDVALNEIEAQTVNIDSKVA